MRRIKGIIFDMDNTLLRSKIDFRLMKQETFKFLVLHNIFPPDFDITNHTTSTIIEAAVSTNLMTEKLLIEMWGIPEKYEVIGMKDADLEPGVIELLEELKEKYRISIVTNNSIKAAREALMRNNIFEYFDYVIARENMGSLKPSPSGFQYILDQHSDIKKEEWISVGDAWIDGKASLEAGIQFIAYQADIEKMNERGIVPLASINDIRQLKDIF